MEELLKIAYMNFLNCYDDKNSKEIRIINTACKGVDKAFDILQKELNKTLFDEVYDKITDSVSDIQEANFIAGFAYCANLLTNGKVDSLPNTLSL